jgi:hypothetical protein
VLSIFLYCPYSNVFLKLRKRQALKRLEMIFRRPLLSVAELSYKSPGYILPPIRIPSVGTDAGLVDEVEEGYSSAPIATMLC